MTRRGIQAVGEVGSCLLAAIIFLTSCGVTPTPTPMQTSSPTPAGAPSLRGVPWLASGRINHENGMPAESFFVVGGRLPGTEPTLSVEYDGAFTLPELELTRAAAVAATADGTVIYVSDDARSSRVHVTSVDGGAGRVVAELPGVVWSATLTPDAASAFLIVLDRRTGDDRGVWQVAVNGQAAPRRVLPPAGAQGIGAIRPVAGITYAAKLWMSPEGSTLARRSCGGVDRPFSCTVDALFLSTGEIRSVGAQFDGDLSGIVGAWLIGWSACDSEGCVPLIYDLETGESTELQPVPEGPVVGLVGGEPVVAVGSRTVARHASAIELFNLRDASSRLVFTDPGNRPLFLQLTLEWELILPPEWIALNIGDELRAFGLRLADGALLPIPTPSIPQQPGIPQGLVRG